MTNEEIEQRLRDIECVLAVVTRQVELPDAARAAMRRLREGVTTEAVSTAQRLEALKSKRSHLLLQRYRRLDECTGSSAGFAPLRMRSM
jgi:hypothetical protein